MGIRGDQDVGRRLATGNGTGTLGHAQLVERGNLLIVVARHGGASVGEPVGGLGGRATDTDLDIAILVDRHVRRALDEQPDHERRHLGPGDVVSRPELAARGDHPHGSQTVDRVLGLLPDVADVAEATAP